MEIKKYIPEITTIGLAETAAAALVTKSAIEGNPISIKETLVLFSFATFYCGIPVAILVGAVKNLYTRYKSGNIKIE